MRRLICALMLLAALSSPSFAGWTRVAESVMPLQAISPETNALATICTATSISKSKGYWLTAAHCIEQPTFLGGEDTVVVKSDRTLDIAVLHTPKLRVKSLNLQSQAPKVGQRILMVGHPMGISAQLFQGTISSLNTSLPGGNVPFMLFDMTACGGNSGSSVVNSKDEIVSILQIGFGRPCSSLTGGAPWSVLVRFIGSYVG